METTSKPPVPRRQAVGKRAARPRRLLRLVSAYLADANLPAPSEAEKGLAQAAAGATLQLSDLDEALGRGEEIDSLAYSRLAGVARRNLRSLGIVEDRSSPAENGAPPSPSKRSLADHIAAHEAFIDGFWRFSNIMTHKERLAHVGARTPAERKMWTESWAYTKARYARYLENTERWAKGLKPLPNIVDPRESADKNDSKKRFASFADRPRGNE